VSIGRLKSEADVARLVDDRIDSGDFASKLRQLQGRVTDGVLRLAGAGPKKEAFGTTTVTITDGTSGTSASFAHGLGAEPSQVYATAQVTADGRNDWLPTIRDLDETSLRVDVRGAAAEHFAVGNPTDVTVYWRAVG
jgi:hypothetical protein